MSKEYQITTQKGNAALRQFVAKEGAALLPMVELLEQGQMAVGELIGELGKATPRRVRAVGAGGVQGAGEAGQDAAGQ